MSELDAAWAEVEDALPAGDFIHLSGPWPSGAYSAWTDRVDSEDDEPVAGPFVGTTPAAPLRALAAYLTDGAS